MHLLNMVLTGGQVHDREKAVDLLAPVNLAGKKVLADKAFASEPIRDYLERRGAIVCIPDNQLQSEA